MNSNEIDSLISKAQRALQSGDKKTAGIVIHQILKEDFTNNQAWQLLHQLFNDSSSLEDFKIQFAQKYFPDKLNLLQAVSEQRLNKSGDKIIDTTQPAPKPKTRKCPFCTEETSAEEKFCHYCGHDLSKENPKDTVKERNYLGLTPKETKLLGVLSIIGLSMIAIFISILQQSNSTRASISNKSYNTPIPTVAILPTPRPSPTIPLEFKTDLKTFLGEAEKMNILTEQGVSNSDFRNQLAQVKSTYAMLINWPSYLIADKDLFDKAITGWELTLEVWDYGLDTSHLRPEFQDLPLSAQILIAHSDLEERCATYSGIDFHEALFVHIDDWIRKLMSVAGNYYIEGRTSINTKLR